MVAWSLFDRPDFLEGLCLAAGYQRDAKDSYASTGSNV